MLKQLNRDYAYIVCIVVCAGMLFIILDTLDDMTVGNDVVSNIIQDLGYGCIIAMLCALLIILINTFEKNIKLKELQKELDELKKR